MTYALQTEPLLATEDGGRWFVRVPWDRADHLHAALRRRGLDSTLCLVPDTRDARLELWPGVEPERILAELNELQQPGAARA